MIEAAAAPATAAAATARPKPGRFPPARSTNACLMIELIARPSLAYDDREPLFLLEDDRPPDRPPEDDRPLADDPPLLPFDDEDEPRERLDVRRLLPLERLPLERLPLELLPLLFDDALLLRLLDEPEPRFCEDEPLRELDDDLRRLGDDDELFLSPDSSSSISTWALKRARSARTARLTCRMPRAAFSISEPGCTSMFSSTRVSRGPISWNVTTPVCVTPSVTFHLIRSPGRCSTISALNSLEIPQIFVLNERCDSSSCDTDSRRCMNSGHFSNWVHSS